MWCSRKLGVGSQLMSLLVVGMQLTCLLDMLTCSFVRIPVVHIKLRFSLYSLLPRQKYNFVYFSRLLTSLLCAVFDVGYVVLVCLKLMHCVWC